MHQFIKNFKNSVYMGKRIIVFILMVNLFYSQNLTCLYELKFKSDHHKDSATVNKFYLDIYGKQSIFRSELERKSDSLVAKTNLGLGRNLYFITDLFARKNLDTGEIQKVIITPTMKTRFFINIDKLNWKITNEKQKIGDLYCQKAELDYGGRHWVAWFAESINLHEGPYIFNGLPGLIVKISDSDSDYDFKLIQLKNVKNSDFFIPQKGKQISWADFQKIMNNYYNDPFCEMKSSGMKYVVGDDKGNVSALSPAIIVKKFQSRMKDSGNNLIELDKAIILK